MRLLFFPHRCKTAILTSALLLLLFNSHAKAEQNIQDEQANLLTLDEAIKLAQSNDEWLLKSRLLESRLQRLSDGADSLPDPTFSLSVLNLPTDGFAFDQEPMTQLKVGATQMLPRGESLDLEEKRHQLAAGEQPYLRMNRRQKVALQTTQLWLKAYEASASYQLVNEARPLFDKLSDIVSASYASSSGNANQQDIIRAQLELVRLNDRLITLKTQKQVSLSKLSQFLFTMSGESVAGANRLVLQLPKTLPRLSNKEQTKLQLIEDTELQSLHLFVTHHPLILANEQRVRAFAVDVDIAEQAYKPQYGVNASYSLRDDSPEGQSRANFFSVGVSVSVPLFSNVRQDANVAGAKLMTEAIKTEKLLLMRELMTGLKSAYESYAGATERLAVYQNQIVPQMAQQAEAALNAYTNDTGDFAEVVRAKIAELDAQVTALKISIGQRTAHAQINYFLAQSSDAQESSHE